MSQEVKKSLTIETLKTSNKISENSSDQELLVKITQELGEKNRSIKKKTNTVMIYVFHTAHKDTYIFNSFDSAINIPKTPNPRCTALFVAENSWWKF